MTTKLLTDAQIRRRKKIQGNISIVGGTMGLTALALRGGAAAKGTGKVGRLVQQAGIKPNAKSAEKLKDYSTGVTTAGAGLGGVGAFNFASYTKAESRKRTPVKKSYQGLDFGLGQLSQGSAERYDEVIAKALTPLNPAGKPMGNSGVSPSKPAMPTPPRATPPTGKPAATGAGAAAPKTFLTRFSERQQIGASMPAKSGTATQSFGRSGISKKVVRKNLDEIFKAYDPERNRQKRLDRYAGATNVAAGGAAYGAGVHAALAVRHTRKGRAFEKNVTSTGKLRPLSGKALGEYKMAGKHAGKAGAFGVTAIGAAVASDRIRSYKKGKGRSYGPLRLTQS